MTVNDLQSNEQAIIIGLDGLDGHLETRLLDLGLMSGALVTFIRRAPLGDPVWLEIKGYQLALRREVAARILVKRKDNGSHES